MTQTDTKRFIYMPVTQTVDSVGLYVTGVGSDLVPVGVDYPRQQHPELYDFSWAKGRILPEFQFILVVSGSGEFESEATGVRKVEAGTVIVLFPDVWHRYRPTPETGWEEYWVSLGGDLLFQWHERGLFSVDRPLTKLENAEATAEAYRELVSLAAQSRELDALRLTACAMKIVASALESDQIESASQGASEVSDLADDAVRKALHIIWNLSHRQVSIDMIAKQAGVNRRTLERRFKDQLGKTLLQELVYCRLQRAKRLLRETRVPIKHVAFAAGFSSLSNLCKVFKRELAVTPGEYRESAKQS